MDDLLSAGGATVFRPTLTGLGARVHLATREIGLNTHVTDVVNEILDPVRGSAGRGAGRKILREIR